MSRVRYQVFIGSTYLDLVKEREAVFKSALRLNCIPIGMEVFSASPNDSWSVIEKIIAESDCYVLIIAGRYGSVDGEGKSFTEREYDHARANGVPVLAFIHKDPELIAQGMTDKDANAQARLAAFIQRIRGDHYCDDWNSPDSLANKVSASLISHKWNPDAGWVRVRDLKHGSLLRLEASADRSESALSDNDELVFPSDATLTLDFSWYRSTGIDSEGAPGSIALTLAEIFFSFAERLATPVPEREIYGILCRTIQCSPHLTIPGFEPLDIIIRASGDAVKQVKIPLLRLRLIELTPEQGIVGAAWKLTSFGYDLWLQNHGG